MSTMIHLYRLNNGVSVLDRTDSAGNALKRPYQYANRTQAQRKIDELRAMGYAARIVEPSMGSRGFYVRLWAA